MGGNVSKHTVSTKFGSTRTTEFQTIADKEPRRSKPSTCRDVGGLNVEVPDDDTQAGSNGTAPFLSSPGTAFDESDSEDSPSYHWPGNRGSTSRIHAKTRMSHSHSKDSARESRDSTSSRDICRDKLPFQESTESLVSYSARPVINVASATNSGINWSRGELIGRGKFGCVYRGLDTTSGQGIALKHIAFAQQSMKAKEQVLAIQNEIAILKTLKSHPSIVSYLGTDRHGMDLYILMEYVPGGSIAQQIKMHGALNEGLCRKWTYEILEGLHHLHSNGIAHRDIKGANILVTSTGSIKLADFGSAAQKQMGMCGPDGFKSVRGTPFWMAPEVVMGETYGWPADIWSLGCTVLEMINGKPPWFDLGQIGALNALAKKIAVPPIPDSMADLGKDFVNACLSYQPDMRPDSQTLLAYDWLAEQAEAAELKAAEKAREAAGLESESKKQRVRPGRLSRDSSRSSHTDMDSFDKIPIKQHNSWVGASDYINSARKSPSPPLATSSPSHQLLDQVKSPTFKTQLRFSLRSNSNLTKKDRGRKSSVQPEARGSTSVKSPSPDDNLSDFEELTQHSESESSNDLEAAPYNGTRPHQIRQQFSDDDLLGQLGSSGTSRSSDSLVPGGLTPGEARMSPLYPPQTPQSLPTLPPVHSPVVDNGAYCQEWLSSPDSPGGTTLPPSQSGRSMRIRTKVLSSCLQLEKLQKHGQMALSTASQ